MIQKTGKKGKTIINRIITITLTVIMTVSLSVSGIPAVPVYASEITWKVVSDQTTNSDLKNLAWDVISGVVGLPGLPSVSRNFFSSPSETTTTTNNNYQKNNYFYRGNTSTSNSTTNYKVFNDYTKVENTQNNYKYSFYNPVTNTYNYTNNFKYNTTNNIYNSNFPHRLVC